MKRHILSGYIFSMFIALYVCVGAAKALVTYGNCDSEDSSIHIFWCYDSATKQNPPLVETNVGRSNPNQVAPDGNIIYMHISDSNCINMVTGYDAPNCAITVKPIVRNNKLIRRWNFFSNVAHENEIYGTCTVLKDNHPSTQTCHQLISGSSGG